MPPKKQHQEEKKLTLGRVGTNLEVGIVGLPNVGKSSFFNVLTKSSVPAENFPFCTIDPSTARVIVPDERFDWLVKEYKPANNVPAVLNVTDIAGLVKGANQGEGLGNAFLSHIKAVDAIFHMIRIFDEEDIVHVEGNVDPVRDIEIISDELRKKDIEYIENRIESLQSNLKRGNVKEKKEELDMATKILDSLKEGKDIRFQDWKQVEIEYLNQLQMLTAKPVIYLLNLSEKDYLRKKNKWLPKVKEWVDSRNIKEPIIPFSAAFERKLIDLPEDEQEVFLKDAKADSALPKIIKTGYQALNLIYYFTAGPDEVKAWTIKKGMLAPQAAGKIHTDFEKGFICAEVMAFDDLKELQTEAAVKAAGKYKQQGRNYEVKDGDIILFRFNVSNSGKKK